MDPCPDETTVLGDTLTVAHEALKQDTQIKYVQVLNAKNEVVDVCYVSKFVVNWHTAIEQETSHLGDWGR